MLKIVWSNRVWLEYLKNSENPSMWLLTPSHGATLVMEVTVRFTQILVYSWRYGCMLICGYCTILSRLGKPLLAIAIVTVELNRFFRSTVDIDCLSRHM